MIDKTQSAVASSPIAIETLLFEHGINVDPYIDCNMW